MNPWKATVGGTAYERAYADGYRIYEQFNFYAFTCVDDVLGIDVENYGTPTRALTAARRQRKAWLAEADPHQLSGWEERLSRIRSLRGIRR